MVDYDGLRFARNSQINESELRLISSLMDAMQDERIPACDIRYEWVICSDCRGEGGNSLHLGVITQDSWNEWDDDKRDDYMSGFYDRSCTACGGTGKVQEMDEESLPEAVQEYIRNYREDAYESASASYYERLAGC